VKDGCGCEFILPKNPKIIVVLPGKRRLLSGMDIKISGKNNRLSGRLY
jgi:hypothetical protein